MWTLADGCELLNHDEQRIIAYHRNPDPNTPDAFPAFEHPRLGRQSLHARLPEELRERASALVRAHLPPERASLPAVLRLVIQGLGVEPFREAWSDTLRQTEHVIARMGTPR